MYVLYFIRISLHYSYFYTFTHTSFIHAQIHIHTHTFYILLFTCYHLTPYISISTSTCTSTTCTYPPVRARKFVHPTRLQHSAPLWTLVRTKYYALCTCMHTPSCMVIIVHISYFLSIFSFFSFLLSIFLFSIPILLYSYSTTTITYVQC